MDNPVNYQDAKRHVERKIGFFIHFTVYVIVNIVLIVLNLSYGNGVPWSLGPLLGWGIGVLFHGMAVFMNAPGATWKHRMIEKELNKHK